MARTTKAAASVFCLRLIFWAWGILFFFDRLFLPYDIFFTTRVLLWITCGIGALLLAGIVLVLLGKPDRFP